MNVTTSHSTKKTSPIVVTVFWLYVSIPLVLGVWSTMQKAMALFH